MRLNAKTLMHHLSMSQQLSSAVYLYQYLPSKGGGLTEHEAATVYRLGLESPDPAMITGSDSCQLPYRVPST